MENNRFYNINDEFGEKYYQLPIVLFKSPKYKKLSLEAKVAFSLLKDRFTYSVKNGWYDTNHNIYFIFTNDELMDLLDVKKEKLSKIKKELINAGLLYQKRQGLNKPNLLYLLKPDVTPEDVYLIDKRNKPLEPQGSSKIELPHDTTQSLKPQGSSIFELPKNGTQSLEPQGSSKIEHNLYYTNLDTNIDSIDTDTITSDQCNIEMDAILLEHEVQNSKIFTKAQGTLIELLANRDPKRYDKLQKSILNAKKKTLNRYHIQSSEFNFDDVDVETEFRNCLLACIKQYRLGKVKNIENYVYSSVVTSFEKIGNERAQNEYQNNKKSIYWDEN